MDFETLWSRYRSGTAGDEEIAQVEAELEKFRLLEAYIEEERPPLPPPDAQRLQEELRRCILEGADRTRFLEAARRASQYVPMLEHAQKLVEEGVSTVDEVIRTLLAL